MKKFLVLAVAMFSTLSVFAQSETEPKEEYLSTINENWFFSAGVGAEFHLFNTSSNDAFDARTTTRFSLSAGKWVNPYMGFRATYAYSTLYVESVYGLNKFISSGETFGSGGVHSLGGDLMFNLSNIIGGYKDRVYVAKPYLGLEANYAYSKGNGTDGLYEYFPQVGIVNEFNVSNSMAINLEIAAAITNGNMYGESAHTPFVWPLRTSLGLTYYPGRGKAREFRTAVSYDSYEALQAQNEALSSDLAKSKQAASTLARDKDALKDELEQLKNQRAKAQQVKEEPAVVVAPVALFFSVGNTTVSERDTARLKYIAEIIKEQPNTKFVVEGYADSATGSAKRNQKISEERADAVCNVLVNKYGVDGSQLEAKGMGATNSMFESMSLNRTVIVKSSK